MGRIGELTNYKSYFESLPAGVFVGAALFALAVIVLVVSSIFQVLLNRCCRRKKDSDVTVKEINVVSDPVTRRSFENPSYLQNVEEKDINTNKDQDINVRISRAGGYLSIENHDYENAAHLKQRTDSDPDMGYENMKDKQIPPSNKKSSREDAVNYDSPPPRRNNTIKEPVEEEDENELPDYDVPKTFTGDDNEEETPDYDVPKSFTS